MQIFFQKVRIRKRLTNGNCRNVKRVMEITEFYLQRINFLEYHMMLYAVDVITIMKMS
jgi:hypothetical protein